MGEDIVYSPKLNIGKPRVTRYAKTLYKPDPPDSVNALFQKYTSDKVPNFFIYAKKKTEKQVEPQNNSCVNRLRTLVPKQRLNFKFKDDIVGKFDYTMLLKNQEVELNNDIINKFKQLTKQLKFKFNANDTFENYNAVYDEVKTEMLQLEYDIDELCDVLVLYLFNEHKSPDKMSFWSVFGDTVYEHLKENINKNLIQCKKCNVRFHRTRVDQFYCPKCRGYQKIGVKKLICCDCGKEFEVEGIVKNKKRCNRCQENIDKINKSKRNQKYYKKSINNN